MAYILVVDDDKEIRMLLKNALEKEGHMVEAFSSTVEITLEKARFADLILLDVMMPGEDGFSYCKRIRGQVDSPILFITAKAEERDLINGLSLGADDYIVKPFTIGELRARVSAHLRRENRQRSHSIRVGNVYLDLSSNSIEANGKVLNFTKSEYAICAALLEHPGQVFSKEQLYEVVFGFDGDSSDMVIVEHIKNIRGKLKNAGETPIETVWGVGYRWKKENR